MIFLGDYVDCDFSPWPEGVCRLIFSLEGELLSLRKRAYELLSKHFQHFPNRVYRYEWPNAYEWDCELYDECPTISLRTPESVLVSGTFGTILLENVSLSGICYENGDMEAITNRGCFPIKDIIEIEVVLNVILTAKDYNKGLSKNGFYYKDEN